MSVSYYSVCIAVLHKWMRDLLVGWLAGTLTDSTVCLTCWLVGCSCTFPFHQHMLGSSVTLQVQILCPGKLFVYYSEYCCCACPLSTPPTPPSHSRQTDKYDAHIVQKSSLQTFARIEANHKVQSNRRCWQRSTSIRRTLSVDWFSCFIISHRQLW